MANYENKKYKLLEYLNNNFSKEKGKEVKMKILDAIPVSSRTFANWLYLTIDDTTEISYSNLKKLSVILEVEVEQLINFKI